LKKKIKVCPVCLSPNIRRSSPFDGWLTPEIYICDNCGYRGPIYAEIEVEINEESDRGSDRGDK